MKVEETALRYKQRVIVRFSEVDSVRTVWHGHYVQYLEDAREAFGREYGLGYMTIFENGFFAPVYELNLHYRHVATVNDILNVEITYCKSIGGKIVFHYIVTRESDAELILTAESVQLFTTQDGEFCPEEPEFYKKWKEHWNVRLA